MIAVGTVLHDTYRIEGEIGRGAMGVVFRAAHLRVPRAFAVKVLEPRIRDVDTSFARFRREAEISSKLGHTNIVEVFDFNRTDEGQAYFVMELLEGHDLADELRHEGPLPPARVIELLTPVASALMAAHAAGIIHRDLKPSNIFVARKGTVEVVKVLDFGVSKILGALDLSTQSEALVGTPAYMSPEQAHGQAKHVDARADQFALAAIAYELLNGRRPFGVHGETPYLTLYKIVSQDPLPLENVPASVAAVVGRALAKAPEARFPDVAAFVDALAAAVANPNAAVAFTSTPVSTTSSSSSRVGGVALALVAFAVVAVVGGVAAIGWRHRHAVDTADATPKPTTHPSDLSPAATALETATTIETRPATTKWTLVIEPANARLVLIGADGTTRALPGPWSAAAARAVEWRAAERPAHARVEADGYEPRELTPPANGAQVSDSIKLARHRVPMPKRHPDLSYPWQTH